MRTLRLIPAVLLVAVGVSGCASGPGYPSGHPDPFSPVRVRYLETLRNQESLISDRYGQFTGSLPAATSLQRPMAVTADTFRVYVTDRAPEPRLLVFDRGERTLRIISSPTPTAIVNERFLDPSGVAISEGGDLFIAEPQQGKVFGMDRNGSLIFTIGKQGDLAYPAALAVDYRRQRLYVADKHAQVIRVYTTLGDWLYDIGRREGNKDLRAPIGIALDGAGTCYVLDAQGNRVHIYDAQGAFLRSFRLEAKNDPATTALKPSGIALDSDGHIYVSDSLDNSIRVYDQDGTALLKWGRTGTQRDDFWTPAGISIDQQDRIYIADYMNGRVQVYQYEK